jgi:hypothetical protein
MRKLQLAIWPGLAIRVIPDCNAKSVGTIEWM